MFARSQGNPLTLRHLVLARRVRAKDASLPALIDAYLSGLPSPARTALDYLALAEPLRRDDLTALAGEEAVEQAEKPPARSRSTTMRWSTRRIRSTRPRAGAALAPDTARALRMSLVEQLAAAPVRTHRRPAAARGAGRRQRHSRSPTLVAAAQQALRFGELTLAERLARAALDRSDGLAARLALGYALAWQGRGRDADAVLAAVDPEQLSPPELMAWALPRAANQFWMLGEPAQATAFLQTTRSRVASPGAQATLDALSATFAMNAGTPLRTLRIAG